MGWIDQGDPMAAPDVVVNLADKFAAFQDHWSPKIVGQINDFHLKAVKVQGEFVWHQHEDTDELILVTSGRLTIQLRDRADVTLGSNEFFVVPRGVEHHPIAEEECEILILELANTVNTGEASDSELTAQDEWI
jgi:mannose-6-phosphate isomerase-like protein (cupin superfamily)